MCQPVDRLRIPRRVPRGVRRVFGDAIDEMYADAHPIARGCGWADDSTALADYIQDAERWTDNAL
jgi:hypothetical protein